MGEAIGNGLAAGGIFFIAAIVLIFIIGSVQKKNKISQAVAENRPGEHAKIASIDKSNPYLNLVNFDLDNGTRISTTVPTEKVQSMVVGDKGSLVHVDSLFVSFTRDIPA